MVKLCFATIVNYRNGGRGCEEVREGCVFVLSFLLTEILVATKRGEEVVDRGLGIRGCFGGRIMGSSNLKLAFH